MTKGRLEAFSDGVFAVVITIMVLEMKAPEGASFLALKAVIPVFCTYVLSFIYVGIYWNNHHHLLQATQHVTGGILWANLHVLFWLSLIPFATAWMGGNHFVQAPVALYGFVLLCCGVAYFILVRMLVIRHGRESVLAKSIGGDAKGMISVAIYAAAIGASFIEPRISCGCYVAVAILWLLPDRRIEKRLASEERR
jgi:uncharacterized membrane protein